jgi:plastocyanin
MDRRDFLSRSGTLLLALPAALGGCAGDAGPAGPPAAGTVREVGMSTSAFLPADITIAPGTTVRWRNGSGIFHNVLSETGHWPLASLLGGDTFEHTFAAAGTYRYRCTPHSTSFTSGMVGVVRVQ